MMYLKKIIHFSVIDTFKLSLHSDLPSIGGLRLRRGRFRKPGPSLIFPPPSTPSELIFSKQLILSLTNYVRLT